MTTIYEFLQSAITEKAWQLNMANEDRKWREMSIPQDDI